MSLTASQITNIAKLMLKSRKVFTWRNNQLRVPGRTFTGEPGVSDLIGIHKETGVFVATEVKTTNDRLREDQKKFLKMVKDSGGIALLAIETKGGNVELVDIDLYLIGKM